MLTRDEVEDIFREHLPEGVVIQFEPAESYVGKALKHPYIRLQIEMGVYTEETIWTDFLSPACSYVPLNKMEVCYDLLEQHAIGADDDLTRAYITMMAMHEAHHFHVNHVPTGAEGHAEAEAACLRETTEAFPDLSDKVAQFEAQSLTHQRVYERMRSTVSSRRSNDRSTAASSLQRP